MYCKNCGKQIDDDAKFCPECGGAVASRSTDADVSNFDQWIDVQEILNACGGNKIEAVKQVKELTGLSLSEAKDLVDKQGNVLSKPITVKNTPWPTSKPQSKRERIKENKQNGVACCPKCGSTSLSANKKGFGIGKAVVGAALTGGIGLVAGNIGAKKVWVTCLNCGHRWKMLIADISSKLRRYLFLPLHKRPRDILIQYRDLCHTIRKLDSVGQITAVKLPLADRPRALIVVFQAKKVFARSHCFEPAELGEGHF